MTYRQLLAGNADFRRLWLAQVISEIGDWLNTTAVLALTLELAGRERQGFAMAMYAIARHLPLFVFGPIAGVVVDRVDRRRVMMAADLLRAVLALGFLVGGRLGSLPVIYTVAASLFVVSAFFNAAKRAALPNVVSSTEELLTANSLVASTTAATIAIGSACGGVVALLVGRDSVLALNAITFIASAEMVRRIRARTNVTATNGKSTRVNEAAAMNVSLRAKLSNSLGRVFTEFQEGLQCVRRDHVLAAIFVIAAGWGLGNGAARSLYSIFGARLGSEAAMNVARPADFGISVLFVAMGLGGVIGAPLARRFNAGTGGRLGATMGRSMIFDGAGLALFSLMPTLWSAAVVLVLREVNFAIWWTAQQTIIMRRTDNAYGGRVFASYETLTTLMMVGSMLVSGAAADVYGIRTMAAVAGIIIALSGLLWFWLQPITSVDEQTVTGVEHLSS